MLVAEGEPGMVLGLLDPESDLWEHLEDQRTFAVSLLSWDDRSLADAFAGAAPAPGGVFRLGTWVDTDWGPVLDSALAWAGCRLVDVEPRRVGYAVAAEGEIEHVTLGDEAEAQALVHRRGRYHPL
jgi:3-hydroxy-9,10-secoandrosta-1,3,5(10)-triene-9,17-dione monooxygenase reductase component